MVHLFYVHSGLAFLCCEYTRATAQLPPEQCVFLQDRDIRLPDGPVRVVPWPEELQFHNFFFKKKFWKNWKPIREFDRFIRKTTDNQEFWVYLPQTKHFIYQLFTTHPLCRGYSYYEEGSNACRPLKVLDSELPPPSFATSVLSYLNFFGRASVYCSFYKDGADKVYSLHDMAFPDFAQKRVVLQPRDDLIPAYQSYAGQFNGALLIIFDTSVESARTTFADYSAALLEAISALQEQGDIGPVYAKLHPAQDPQNKPKLTRVLDESFGESGYILLDSSDNVEAILLQNRDMRVLTAMCSVGFYANLWGHKVYSFADRLIRRDPQFVSSFEEAPVQYREVMLQI